MKKVLHLATTMCVLAFCTLSYCQAEEITARDMADIKREIESLRSQLSQSAQPAARETDLAIESLENKYGPNAKVTTNQGRLTINGLLQIWNYRIQNDSKDFRAGFANNDPTPHSNETFDNDGYRIRRAEIKLAADITKDITAVIMFDPTGQDENNSFPGLPSNQGLVFRGDNSFRQDAQARGYSRGSGSSGDIDDPLNSGLTEVEQQRIRNGTVLKNRVLQDAYINYHADLIPNHNFTVGQFKAPAGLEAYRNSGQLDFAERAMINQFGNQRDLGIMVHGSWLEGKLQYWIGGFNSAGSFHNTFASYQNRSDDNDTKDLAFRIQGRPIWGDETWGSLELGYARQDGIHGESAPGADGLSSLESKAYRQYGWVWYRPVGPVSGWWLKGEYYSMRDRYQSQLQFKPRHLQRSGWYAATGYKMSESIFADDLQDSSFFLWKMLYKAEFAFRYEQFYNLLLPDLVSNNKTDKFKTDVTTIGVNYYWKGYNVRSQVNYMLVNEHDDDNRRIREVKNNVLLFTNQIQF